MCCQEIRQAFGVGDECCHENILHAREGGKKFTIQLPAKSKDTVCRIHVDGSLIQDNTQRKCDYWFRICQNNKHQNYFIEFKDGTHMKDAYEQITSTIVQVRQKIALPKESIYGIVVANRVPLAGPQIQIMKDQFRRDYGADFRLKSKELLLVLT